MSSAAGSLVALRRLSPRPLPPIHPAYMQPAHPPRSHSKSHTRQLSPTLDQLCSKLTILLLHAREVRGQFRGRRGVRRRRSSHHSSGEVVGTRTVWHTAPAHGLCSAHTRRAQHPGTPASTPSQLHASEAAHLTFSTPPHLMTATSGSRRDHAAPCKYAPATPALHHCA